MKIEMRARRKYWGLSESYRKLTILTNFLYQKVQKILKSEVFKKLNLKTLNLKTFLDQNKNDSFQVKHHFH